VDEADSKLTVIARAHNGKRTVCSVDGEPGAGVWLVITGQDLDQGRFAWNLFCYRPIHEFRRPRSSKENSVQSSRGSERFRERGKRKPSWKRYFVVAKSLWLFLPDHRTPERLISPGPRVYVEIRLRTRFPYTGIRFWWMPDGIGVGRIQKIWTGVYADLSRVPNRL